MSEPQNPHPEEPTGAAPPPSPPPPPTDAPPPPAYAPPPPAYAPQAAASTVGQPGDLLMRFLARLIDGILLAVVTGVIVVGILVGAIMGESATMFGPGDNLVAALIVSVLSVAINLGYFAYMESSRGQTVGKMILKLQTRGPGGGNPTFEEAVKRNIFIAIGLVSWIPVLGLLAGLAQLVAYIMVAVTINNSATKQGWHDNFAGGTQVVKTA